MKGGVRWFPSKKILILPDHVLEPSDKENEEKRALRKNVKSERGKDRFNYLYCL